MDRRDELNSQLWNLLQVNEGDWVFGTIKEGVKGWGNFESTDNKVHVGIHSSIMKKHSLSIGQNVKVITKSNPDGPNLHLKQLKNI